MLTQSPNPKEMNHPPQTPQQITRHKEVQAILDGYREGTHTIADVKAIPKEDIRAAREYLTNLSIEQLEKELPGFFDGHIN